MNSAEVSKKDDNSFDFFYLFNEHPNSVDQNYFGHLKDALRFSLTCGVSSVALFIHAFFPFLFVTRGSDWISSLYEEMSAKKRLILAKQQNHDEDAENNNKDAENNNEDTDKCDE